MLGGASLAFTTSIIGISCSILFSWREKHQTHRLQKQLAGWNSFLDERLDLITPEQLSSMRLEEAKKQTLQLERFNTDLAVSIASALDERVAGRLSPILQKLVDAVEGLRIDRGETSQKLLENIVAEFKSSLSGATGYEMDSIVASLKELDGTLRRATQAISAGQREMQENTRKIAVSVESAIKQGTQAMHEGMARAMNDMTTNLLTASKGTAEKLIEAGGATYDRINKATVPFEDSVSRLVDATDQVQALMKTSEETLQKMNEFPMAFEQVLQKLQRTVEPLHETAGSIGNAASGIERAMENTVQLVEVLRSLSAQMEDSNKQLTGSWREYTERFKDVDVSLKGIFQEVNEGLRKYTDQVKEFAVEFDNLVAKAIADLGGAVGELDEAVEDLSEALTRIRR